MQYLIYSQVAVFFIYLVYITIRYGVQPSISDSWYELPGRWKFVFTFIMWFIGVPVVAHFTGGDKVNMYFFAAAGMGLLGAAPMFKEKHVEKAHVGGVVAGVAFTAAGQVFLDGIWIPTVVASTLVVALLFIKWIENKTWWTEIIIFVGLQIGFLLKYNLL